MKNIIYSIFFIFALSAAVANSQEDKERILSVDRFSWDKGGRRTVIMGNNWSNCYEFLFHYVKYLKRDEVESCSNEDIKKIYYDACRSAGVSFNEAKEKIKLVIFD